MQHWHINNWQTIGGLINMYFEDKLSNTESKDVDIHTFLLEVHSMFQATIIVEREWIDRKMAGGK